MSTTNYQLPASPAKRGEPTTNYSPDTLLPTEKIIALARLNNVDFGPGDPNERIRYYIKLGILPHAVRKSSQFTVHGSLSTVNGQRSTVPVGHLPFWTIERLKHIEALKDKGLSYPKIAEKLKKEEQKAQKTAEVAEQKPAQIEKPIVNDKSRIIFLQKIGLSENDINQKLNCHQQEVHVHRIKRKLDLSVFVLAQDSRRQERMCVAVHTFHVPIRATRCLAQRHRAAARHGLEQLPALGGQYLPHEIGRSERNVRPTPLAGERIERAPRDAFARSH